jgi:two-component sensor histidine kinase
MFNFSTFRSRLIFLFALATFPAVALALAMSWRAYENARYAKGAAYVQTAVSVAIQERAVLRGAGRTARTLLATGLAELPGDRCEERLKLVVQANRTYRAIAIVTPAGIRCYGGDLAALQSFDAATLNLGLAGPVQAGEVGTIAIAPHDGRSIVAVLMPRAERDVMMAVIVDSRWLDEVIEDIVPIDNGTVAVVDTGQMPIVSNGREEGNSDWLPAQNLVVAASQAGAGGNALAAGASTTRASPIRGQSRDDRDFAYVVEPIENGLLHVIAGFPSGRFGAAERQLAIGLAFPFVLFLIVLGVAWFAIDRLFLSWVRRLDGTARRLAFGDFSVRAELPADAPLELRQYATAFDQMTEVLSSRTRELAAVAQQRSNLLRELHHRVKNNFQVISSFLNLMKRERTGETRDALAFSESRVHAMAAAYKLALAQGDIRLVSVTTLIADVLNYIQHAAELADGSLRIETDGVVAFLELDRAIPLALVIVETLWPVVRANGEPIDAALNLGLAAADRLTVEIRNGGVHAQANIRSRFQRAFLNQLEAEELPVTDPHTIFKIALPLAAPSTATRQ